MTHPEFEPFHNIRRAVEKAIEPLGVEFLTWTINTGDNDEDGPNCSMLLLIKPEAFLNDEEKAIRAQFDEIEAAERELEAQRRHGELAVQAKSELLNPKPLRGEGIFAEDDDSPEE